LCLSRFLLCFLLSKMDLFSYKCIWKKKENKIIE
jgi:hypothetical protein